MYLYKSFCYPTFDAVKRAIQSNVTLDQFGLIQDVTELSPNLLSISYQLPDLTYSSLTYQVPVCGQAGFDNSYSGLTMDDSIELSGMILLVLAIAFGFRTLKRSI